MMTKSPREWKDEQGISYKQLSEMTGFREGYLCDVINGKKRGSIDVWDAFDRISGGKIKRVIKQ
ncbi:MAG: XRE family transcriptional regulator [Spartobacteria bacterium]|nr:XRE family transcriptional regulator [Spartobacteria bacterium]